MNYDDVAGLVALPFVMTVVLMCFLVLLLPTVLFLLTLQRTVRDGCVPPITPLPSGVLGGAQPLQMHLVRPPSPTPE